MAKRFTATEKWNDGWFLELSKERKLVWLFLLDSCTNAGRWIKNIKMLNFCCESTLVEEDLKMIFNGRLVDCGDFFFIPKFLKFQYPHGLNSEKPAIISVRNEILRYNLYELLTESLGNDYLIIKDKDKEKDKNFSTNILSNTSIKKEGKQKTTTYTAYEQWVKEEQERNKNG
jgi:hypothetical protein